MKKIVLSVVVMFGALFGIDYSKMSNEELIGQAGKFPVKEAVAYHKELQKRADEMTVAQSREFFAQVKQAKVKNEENMKRKDLRERNAQIRSLLIQAGMHPHMQGKGMMGDTMKSDKMKKRKDCGCE